MDRSIYAERRERFYSAMGGGVALLATHVAQRRNIHHEYPFRPESMFLYLTGYEQPGAFALFTPEHRDRFHSFVPPRDPQDELWNGPREDAEEARRRSGADRAYDVDQLFTVLGQSTGPSGRLYYHLGRDRDLDRRVIDFTVSQRSLARRGAHAPGGVLDPQPLLGQLRLIKDDVEIGLMERAANITCEAHRDVFRTLRPGQFEYEIEAQLTAGFRRHGSTGHAYLPIVAGGDRATVLHYTQNSQKVEDGQLLLVDAGAECQWYASDVTRTIPVGARFSPAQRKLYEIVLAAQQAVIQEVKPGITRDHLTQMTLGVLVPRLIDLGFLEGTFEEALVSKNYRRFFPHTFGHWLGLDCHDPSPYVEPNGDSIALRSGMVLTVEPGLYVPTRETSVPADFRGIGIRIEDNLVVTDDGSRVLTEDLPKTVGEIEDIRGRALATR